MVWIFEIYQSNVRDRMRMDFGLWSVIAQGYDVSYWMWSRRERGPCLDVARVLGTREGDRRVDVCCDRLQRDIPHDRRKCNRGGELFVTCILVQRHEATSQEGAFPSNSLSLLISCTALSLCSIQTRLVLNLYLTRPCKICCMAQAIRVEGSALDISALSLHAHLIADCAWTPSSIRVLCNRMSIRE